MEEVEFPELPKLEEMIDSLDYGQIQDLYNTIYTSKYGPNFGVNEHGYAKTPFANIANKMWYISSNWQYFNHQ